MIKMNHTIKFAAVLASFTLLTGCGALNSPAENSVSEAPAESTAEETSAAESTDAASSSDESTADASNGDSNTAAAAIGKPEKDKLELGYLNSTAHLLAFVAQEEGYFAEEGLNVTLTQFSSAGELVNGLESGKLDVAFIGSVPTLTFQSQGHDVTIIGGAMTNGHGYVIKSEFAEKDEEGVEILKGRNVASVKNSVQDAELQILLKDAGIEIGEGEDKVNIVYFDSQKDAYAALSNQTIDAASV